MEKNVRFSNQSLCKGQIVESKKNQEASIKWPRNSKRREQPNYAVKPDTFRTSNVGKGQTALKTRNQTNYNYDKRTKHRPESANGIPLYAAIPESEVDVQYGEQHQRTGLVAEGASGIVPARHELHSVFSPGSKKQSLNHLLNFHYAPRERDQPVRLSRTGNNRGYTKKISYNKEQFLQANCQFVVRADEDYTSLLESPDQLVDWGKIVQIHVLSPEEPQCPICLYPPIAAKMTKCGHVYCWPCILHYLALSDKTWRKCPICYDAIHLPDLRSAVLKPLHSYSVDEIVTFQLMRRQKLSMNVTTASETFTHDDVPRLNSADGNSILCKLLLADTTAILQIVEREQQELENQMVLDGDDYPENIFVQQALEHLKERKQDILINKIISYPPLSSAPTCEVFSVAKEDAANCSFDTQDHADRLHLADFMIDEETNFSLRDIDIAPTSSSDFYYFYQSVDGHPLYLHSLNIRILQAMYGSLDKSPPKIIGKIIHKDSCSMTEDLRKRLKYLQHLPVCSQFEVVEIEFQEGTISNEVLTQFKGEIKQRRKNRERRAREERIRERQIYEFNERQLGKSLARSANIPIDSTAHFPSCGGSSSYDFSHEPSLGSVDSVNNFPDSPSMATPGRSWSTMLSAAPSCSRWPTLPSGSSLTQFGAVASSKAKKSNAPLPAQSRKISESDFDDSDGEEEAKAPAFRNDLSLAIEVALEKVSLGHEKVTANKNMNIKPNGNSGMKKRKNKKTLIFASGMNLN